MIEATNITDNELKTKNFLNLQNNIIIMTQYIRLSIFNKCNPILCKENPPQYS